MYNLTKDSKALSYAIYVKYFLKKLQNTRSIKKKLLSKKTSRNRFHFPLDRT